MKYFIKAKRYLGVLSCVLLMMSAFVLTASAQIKDTSKDVTLTIYALQTEEGSQVAVDTSVTGEKITLPDKKPIAGVSFALYKTADDETNADDDGLEPDFTTPLTGEDGSTVIVIPAAAQGRYLVTEAAKPANAVGRTIPFFVDLPMTAPDGESFLYEVFAYPKQMMLDEDFPEDTESEQPQDSDEDSDKDVPAPMIHKKVSEDGGKTWQDKGNIASIVGDRAYWKVTVDVPSSIGRMQMFTVSDVLDKRLEPPKASEVKVSSSGKALGASAYKVSVSGQTLTVEFTPKEITEYIDSKIDVIFPMAIRLKEDNAVGVLIPNTAALTYTRLKGAPEIGSDTDISTDTDGQPTDHPVTTIESETPVVWTAQIKGFKHDGDRKALSGAEFTLYSDKACKNKLAAAVSDRDGGFEFTGLRDGTYYLKETKTPDGYQPNENTIEVTVKMKDNKAVELIDVLNVKKTNLPVTGGAGIIGISLTGLATALLGGVFIALALKERAKTRRAEA